MAETGEPAAQRSGLTDPDGIGLHNDLWAPSVSLAAGTAMMWWWDSYIAPYNLYHHFTVRLGSSLEQVPCVLCACRLLLCRQGQRILTTC